ncbi:MAG TPA: VOC family protein [Longimicrobiales bacterium]|nr:VOC family protein [Longimicrobiales bacterium]
MKAVNPYLNFAGTTEEAFKFYRSVFGGEFLAVVRFKDFPSNEMGVPATELDQIAHIALPFGPGNVLMGTDTLDSWKPLKPGNNFYITLEADSEQEAEKLFNKLSSGGQAEMPLQQTQWAEKYGQCVDKHGVQWIISYTGNVEFSAGHSG